MIDAFMVFLMYVGGVQFVYACLTGGYPFNSFLAGFAGAVGQFVLAASLRSQVDKANRTEFPEVSPERYLPRSVNADVKGPSQISFSVALSCISS